MHRIATAGRRTLLALLALAVCASGAIGQPAKGCAIVLLHGKWGNPGQLGPFARKLLPVCDYRALEMPWSQRRGYDKDYPSALREISAQVKDFRQQGYRRVLVAGHGLGANAAIAYAAEVGNVDGVIALAPGHFPRAMYERGGSREVVDAARKLVAAGKGQQSLSIEDTELDQRRSIAMSAAVMVSYFDPQGLGDMPTTARRIAQNIPLMWVIGRKDPLFAAGEAYAYAQAPPHPLGRYAVVNADHAGTPDAAAKPVIEWVRLLE